MEAVRLTASFCCHSDSSCTNMRCLDLFVQISDHLCAVLYDEEDCDTGAGLLRVKNGEEGRLAKWTPFTSKGLERNDIEVT